MKVKSAPFYYQVLIDNQGVYRSTPKEIYREMRNDLEKEASKILDLNRKYKTEKEAIAALAKLPKHFDKWAQVALCGGLAFSF